MWKQLYILGKPALIYDIVFKMALFNIPFTLVFMPSSYKNTIDNCFSQCPILCRPHECKPNRLSFMDLLAKNVGGGRLPFPLQVSL